MFGFRILAHKRQCHTKIEYFIAGRIEDVIASFPCSSVTTPS